MSYCAVHMQKMKMSAMAGIQSHNQREHESRKNKDIDYSKSHLNADTVLDAPANYIREVKRRIEELNLPKAVRKDAVVYCSFIVSSDRAFFERLGEMEHVRLENRKESVALGLVDVIPFEYMNDSYREKCIRAGAMRYFEKATKFFKERYGEENVLNGTVHFDEATPHMHLGVVPVTSDGRLSAKTLFNPLELQQLQTQFAEKVGKSFELERGVAGSKNAHLTEVEFKLQKEQEKLERVSGEVRSLEQKQRNLEQGNKDLAEQAEKLSKTISGLQTEISALDTQKRLLERLVSQIKQVIERVMGRIADKGSASLEHVKSMVMERQATQYIEHIGKTAEFETYKQEIKDVLDRPAKRRERDGK